LPAALNRLAVWQRLERLERLRMRARELVAARCFERAMLVGT
jgi:hypothetical protein